MKGVLFLTLLAVALCAAVPTQLSYKIGKQYVYDVAGVVQNNGFDTDSEEYLHGYYSNMKATMVMQPTKEDATSYTFVMNLYNTVVSASNSSTPGPFTAVGGSKALGQNVYFTQLKTGEITLIQYYSNDPIYYVNVKIGAINAFQTSIVAVGATTDVLESDPVGNHTTKVTGSLGSNGALLLTKRFNQANFLAFPDPTVNAQNMDVDITAVAGVHPDGYIESASYNQASIFINAGASKRSMTNSTGLDMMLSAIGTMNIQFNTASGFVAEPFGAMSDGYVSSGMFDFAAQSSSFALANIVTDVAQAIASLIKDPEVKLSELTTLGNHLRRNPAELAQFLPVLQVLPHLDVATRDRIFFVLTVAQAEDLIVKFGLNNADCQVQLRAALAAPHIKAPTPALLSALQLVATHDACPEAQISARSVLGQPAVSGSTYPFNKTYGTKFHLGGKVAAVDFAANVFAGTNLNCKNTNFNFQGSAEASATASLFGYSQEAFDAQIVYGQADGAPLADSMTLSIWGKQVWNHALPSLPPCKSATYPLAHFAPGFSVQHTLWVSIIPVVFSASANLNLNLNWGWNVCPSDLSASVNVNGNGAFQLSGASFTDLLLLRAGFELSGSFNAAITPTAYINGNACEVGFEVDEQNSPMNAAVSSYYQWRECKFLFFDCKWGKHNQQTWWKWSSPAKDTVLFKKSYSIAA